MRICDSVCYKLRYRGIIKLVAPVPRKANWEMFLETITLLVLVVFIVLQNPSDFLDQMAENDFQFWGMNFIQKLGDCL
jgi:hypothetical protein